MDDAGYIQKSSESAVNFDENHRRGDCRIRHGKIYYFVLTLNIEKCGEATTD